MRTGVATILLALSAPALAGCRDAAEARESVHHAPAADGVRIGYSTEGARHFRTVTGFNDPESVRYDPEQDVFFVSNVAGFGSLKDGNGYISRVAAAGAAPITTFVQGGANGVTLHAPKGMTIQGDTLWVTDIDVVRGFHRRSGAPVRTIDFTAHRPVQLNDIATGPGGTLRVTDTGIHMVYEGNIHVGTDRVFEIAADRTVDVVAQGLELRQPNGITWDSAGRRWVVVAFDRFAGDIYSLRMGTDTAKHMLHRGKGQLDGVEVLRNGAVLFSSWADSSIHVWRDGRDVRVIRQVPEPADIGVDTRRGRVAIPLAMLGRVQIWELGGWW